MTAAGDENIEFTNSASPDRRIILPAKLAKIKTAEKFPSEKFKWNTNEVCFVYLFRSFNTSLQTLKPPFIKKFSFCW